MEGERIMNKRQAKKHETKAYKLAIVSFELAERYLKRRRIKQWRLIERE